MRIHRSSLAVVTAALLIAIVAADASALRYQVRPKWQVGVGYGIGRGTFTGADGTEGEYRNGASPHIRFGRMIGEHYMVSANYEAWLIEFGNEPPNAAPGADEIKVRRMMQNLALGFAVFPGDQLGPLNGLYLRAGVGMGWAGTGAKEAVPGEEQEGGERIDEWGIGVFGEAGYEFWVAHNFTAGLGVTYNYFNIEADIVDTSWFTAAVLNLNLYF